MKRLQRVEHLKEKTTSATHNREKVVHFSGDEFIQIEEVARPFLEKGLSERPPNFVIVMGGVGSGKTTLRRQQFGQGYVHFDFGDIYTAMKNAVGENNPKLTSCAALASDLILQGSFNEKKNIVIEIIGETTNLITPVIDKMTEIGYKVHLRYVECDPTEAYTRHLKAVEEDKDYLSAHFTQEATLSSFYHQLGLDMKKSGGGPNSPA